MESAICHWKKFDLFNYPPGFYLEAREFIEKGYEIIKEANVDTLIIQNHSIDIKKPKEPSTIKDFYYISITRKQPHNLIRFGNSDKD
jgi:hypothetical protein